jgi:hypothetical protein
MCRENTQGPVRAVTPADCFIRMKKKQDYSRRSRAWPYVLTITREKYKFDQHHITKKIQK